MSILSNVKKLTVSDLKKIFELCFSSEEGA